MNEYTPVWITTPEQLRQLELTFREATLPTKLLGTFKLPEGTAHLRGLLLPWMRVPLVLVAQGRLIVDTHRLTFTSTPFRAPGWRAHGVHPDLRWELSPTEVTVVEPADFSSPVARLFDIPFTRVRSSRSGLLNEFLMCVGGRFSMPKVRTRSLELRQALHVFARRSATEVYDD